MNRPIREPQTRTFIRTAFLLALAAIVVGSTGCTTSRAIRAWYAGAKAEDRGRHAKARRHYAEAFERNADLAGAELARIRLASRTIAGRKKAAEALDELVSDKGSKPEVAIFAAWWSLFKGDAKAARQQASGVEIPPKHPHRALLEKRLATLKARIVIESERHKRTKDAATIAVADQVVRSEVALNSGDYSRARDLLNGVIARGDAVDWRLRFNLALAYMHLGELDLARRQLQTAASSCKACPAVHRNLAVLAGKAP